MKKHQQELRVYVTHAANIWRIYTIFINADGSLYYAIPSKHHFFDHKFSYHPDGTMHFKRRDGKAKYRKRGWPSFESLTICEIDSFGFETKSFLADDAFFRELKKENVKQPALVFDIGTAKNAFVLRIYFGKREAFQDRGKLAEKVNSTGLSDFNRLAEKAIDVQVHDFGVVKTDLGDFDLCCAVALIERAEL